VSTPSTPMTRIYENFCAMLFVFAICHVFVQCSCEFKSSAGHDWQKINITSESLFIIQALSYCFPFIAASAFMGEMTRLIYFSNISKARKNRLYQCTN